MEVYHGTAARFPIRELTYGPDGSAMMGTPWPGLWLTKDPRLAALYASWSADCTGESFLRVIAVEIKDKCPRKYSLHRPEDFVVRYPEREYENGNLRVMRGYRIQRRRDPEVPYAWRIRAKWNITETDFIVPHAGVMESLPSGFRLDT